MKAVLPVRLKSSAIAMMTWGRGQEEAGSLPQAGWAKLESIKAGMWDWFFPKLVKIKVDSFMGKGSAGKNTDIYYPKVAFNGHPLNHSRRE